MDLDFLNKNFNDNTKYDLNNIIFMYLRKYQALSTNTKELPFFTCVTCKEYYIPFNYYLSVSKLSSLIISTLYLETEYVESGYVKKVKNYNIYVLINYWA